MKMSRNTISTGNSSSTVITLEEFRELPKSKAGLGKLFIALLEESDWSSDLSGYGHFEEKDDDGTKDFICIRGKHFQDNNGSRVLVIRPSDEILGINDVAKLVMNSYGAHRQSIWTVCQTLKESAGEIKSAERKIKVGLAKKYIQQKLPQFNLEEVPELTINEHIFFMDREKHHILFVKISKVINEEDPPIYEKKYETLPHYFSDEEASKCINTATEIK